MKLSKRNRKKLITALLCLLLILITTLANKYNWQNPSFLNTGLKNNPAVTGLYNVVKIDDGDTIIVDMNGKNETIRMIGVDTPEVKDPRKPVQCFGTAASSFTKNLIGNNPVKLESDPTNTNRDRYNRLLRYVYLPDGKLVNAEIIKQGYGFAYTGFPFIKIEIFKQLQQEAKQQNIGLWDKCQPLLNKYGGYSSNAE